VKKFPPPISSSVSFGRGWGEEGESYYPQAESNTTPPSPKTEITNVLFYILNFASIIKFKM
jgi:hypothetical protein